MARGVKKWIKVRYRHHLQRFLEVFITFFAHVFGVLFPQIYECSPKCSDASSPRISILRDYLHIPPGSPRPSLFTVYSSRRTILMKKMPVSQLIHMANSHTKYHPFLYEYVCVFSPLLCMDSRELFLNINITNNGKDCVTSM